MPVGFRNAAGVDFDDLFDPDIMGDGPTAPFLRTSAGAALRYAAISYGTKGPDVGFRTSAGVDVSNLWAARGTARYALPFDGQSYSAGATAQTGASGQTSAQLNLEFLSNGTWRVFRTIANAIGAGSTVLASGTWLPSGESAAGWEIRFRVSPTSGAGAVTNGASAFSALSTGRQLTLRAAVTAASSDSIADARAVTADLRRVGGNASPSTANFTVSAAGWV